MKGVICRERRTADACGLAKCPAVIKGEGTAVVVAIEIESLVILHVEGAAVVDGVGRLAAVAGYVGSDVAGAAPHYGAVVVQGAVDQLLDVGTTHVQRRP